MPALTASAASSLQKALWHVARDAMQTDGGREALLHLLDHDDDHARVTARKLGVALTKQCAATDATTWCGLSATFQGQAELMAWQLQLLPSARMQAITDNWLRAIKDSLQLQSRL
jgi:hypothetical protein